MARRGRAARARDTGARLCGHRKSRPRDRRFLGLFPGCGNIGRYFELSFRPMAKHALMAQVFLVK